MVSVVMPIGEQNPTLDRDVMFAVLMILLDGLIGISLLYGGRWEPVVSTRENLGGKYALLVSDGIGILKLNVLNCVWVFRKKRKKGIK